MLSGEVASEEKERRVATPPEGIPDQLRRKDIIILEIAFSHLQYIEIEQVARL